MSIEKFKNRNTARSFVDDSNKEALTIEPAEVFDIILNSDNDDYIDDTSIGIIKFKRLFSDKQKSGNDLFVASPLTSYIQTYPVKHEIVLIVSAPSSDSGTVDQSTSFYYTDVVNVWGNVNHNALPYSTFPIKIKNKKDSDNKYTSFTGNQNKEEEIELGEYFEENIKKPSLMPYEGDNIIQSRFGSSIRFSGIHIKSGNPWSKQGETSDPIIIIRNDKKDAVGRFVTEDINKDASSVYICDGQVIPLIPSYSSLKSFDDNPEAPINATPTAPSSYKEKQIIINSGRLFFNSSQESIFLSSNKSISIAAKDTVNIDFGEKVIVGDVNKAQLTILGEDLIDLLDSIKIPSPMGPIEFKLSPQWIAKQNGKAVQSKKTYME